ncbi:MAG: hypothetical protein M3405_04640 [Acidobacteriota bacterium]|jgi:hypothetical protein|nr:hypothetical protein [Acidobacteriota bacterium]
MDILSLFAYFETLVESATGRQLGIIAEAVLAMSGRCTMLGISRWAEKGVSAPFRGFSLPFCRGLSCWSGFFRLICLTRQANIFWRVMRQP